MIHIDGRMGEGGGQVIRTSLALAALTGQAVTIDHVRGGRSKPGLLNQHLTALEAMTEITGGEVEGAERGASRVVFRPGAIRPGRYHFDIGTAGSVNLVLQTVMFPLLLGAGDRCDVVVTGGTHNDRSPTTDYLIDVVVPILERMGADLQVKLDRHGFFPRGGGKVRLTTKPSVLRPVELTEPPADVQLRCRALLSELPELIGTREVNTFCRAVGRPRRIGEVVEVPKPRGPGNAFVVDVRWDGGREQITSFGAKRKRAEVVAEEAAAETLAFLDAGVPVGEHLADQLLLPMALAGGGRFATGPLSPHATTNMEVIQAFLGVEWEVEGGVVGVRPRPADPVGRGPMGAGS